MKPGGGKQKGAQFEREVCKKLSLWISDGIRDDMFWRSAMSGGRASIGLKKGMIRVSQQGDVSVIAGGNSKAALDAHQFLFNFVVECKSVKDYQLEKFLWSNYGFNNVKGGIIGKAIIQSQTHEKGVFIIAKANRKPALVIFPHDKLGRFIVPENQRCLRTGMVFHGVINGFSYVIFKLDDFLSDIKFRSWRGSK